MVVAYFLHGGENHPKYGSYVFYGEWADPAKAAAATYRPGESVWIVPGTLKADD